MNKVQFTNGVGELKILNIDVIGDMGKTSKIANIALKNPLDWTYHPNFPEHTDLINKLYKK